MKIDNQQGSMLKEDLQRLMLYGIDVTEEISKQFTLEDTIKFIVNLNESYDFFRLEMNLSKDQVKRIKRKVTNKYLDSIPIGFRPIKGYEDYLVNCKGHIITKKTRRILKQNLSQKGNYCVVCLSDKDSVKVHRVVAEAFIPNPEGKPEVNHKDGIKTNNCVDNLEWCTTQENLQHKQKHNLGKTIKAKMSATGQNNSQAILTSEDVFNIRNSREPSIVLANRYSVSQHTINDVRARRSWKHI